MTMQPPYTEKRLASSLGYWCALLTTLGGVVYFLLILGLLLTGQFIFPPSDAVQLFGGIISLLFCPFIVLVMASLHAVTDAERKVFSLGGLAFTALFAGLVSINRFTQLGVVRLSIASEVVEGLEWFLPYGAHSVLFGLEMLGWGWFLGLAMLMAAPVFSGGRLQLWLRWLMISYGILALSSAVLYLIGSPLAAIGFIAWGLILFVITGLLTVYFRRFGVHGG
jgi:hypothetical protein